MSWFFVGAAVVGVVSAAASADSQRKAAHARADIERQRAEVAKQQANVNEDAQRRRADMIIGQQRAAVAQSGFDFSGTSADLLSQSAVNAELDALNIRYAGQIGVLTSNQNAMLADREAGDAQQAGYLNAASSALSAYGGYKRSSAKLG